MSTRILIAEDNCALRSVIKFNLEVAGYQVTAASDGAEALRHLEQGDPDLIVTDHEMPNMNGCQLCERIRSVDRFKNTPIIMLSAKGLELDDSMVRAQFRVSEVVSKPFSPSELVSRVQQVLAEKLACT
jgi:CheY-like chemotaxis protein